MAEPKYLLIAFISPTSGASSAKAVSTNIRLQGSMQLQGSGNTISNFFKLCSIQANTIPSDLRSAGFHCSDASAEGECYILHMGLMLLCTAIRVIVWHFQNCSLGNRSSHISQLLNSSCTAPIASILQWALVSITVLAHMHTDSEFTHPRTVKESKHTIPRCQHSTTGTHVVGMRKP